MTKLFEKISFINIYKNQINMKLSASLQEK